VPVTDWRPTVADGLRRLRIRTTVVATLIVGVALLVASVSMVAFVGASLTNSLRDVAIARTRQVAERLSAGERLPEPADPEEESVQLLGPGEPIGPVEIDGPFLYETTPFVAADGSHHVIVVARGLDDITEAQHTVARGLWVGVPVLLVVVALVTWRIAGRTLRPVAAAQERQRRFVSDAAHELRSPVASIRQHAEVADAHPDTTDVRELASTVAGETVRIQDLVDDLLLLAGLDEGVTQLPRLEVDLDDMVLAEAERLRGAGVQVDTASVGAGRVLGDARSLERSVRNLGDNAARHAASRVSFSLAALDGHVTLRVDDDGPGIPEADRERVFERFERLDEARDRGTGGTGLGLAIVREVARAHGGDVTLSEGPLGGLRVEVRFPNASNAGSRRVDT
jgi:signal transduction histidine kinase